MSEYVYKYGRRFKSETAAERWHDYHCEVFEEGLTVAEIEAAKKLIEEGFKQTSRKYRNIAIVTLGDAGVEFSRGQSLDRREFHAFRTVGGESWTFKDFK